MDQPAPQPPHPGPYGPSQNGGHQQTGVYWLQRLAQAIGNLQQTWRQTNDMKVLAEGQLTNAKLTLYTVPINKKATVRFMSVGNITAGAVTATIFYKKAASRQLYAASVAANSFAQIVSGASELSLDSGDIIEGIAGANASIDYIISGVEQ